MKINPKILSIPPYISTSWKNIASIHVENDSQNLTLVVTLHSGARIEVPRLELSIIETIFTTHARYMEQEEKQAQPKPPLRAPFNLAIGEQVISLGLPFKNNFTNMENFGSLLQHNPEQANSPDLPPDVLQKIAQLSKNLSIDDINAVPKPEPHCNCTHCQIARALQVGISADEEKADGEEIVTDEDLKFKTWDVAQTSDKLFVVTNPLDTKEHYNVYLGEPVGCTCGHHHCEHIRAVLSS